MKDKNRKRRQEKVAKLLYELGMDVELVSKISGIETDDLIKKKMDLNTKIDKYGDIE